MVTPADINSTSIPGIGKFFFHDFDSFDGEEPCCFEPESSYESITECFNLIPGEWFGVVMCE